ncbi:MAG: glycosyltransferase family 4 protein [Chloroflexi bacterium]|nr:glycosyltransferase family 4 protein [Chloroflexota bacterium]
MRIGFVSTRLAGVDGVSLETEKWVKVLERMGHEVFYCAGELDEEGPPGLLVPEMHFKHPVAEEVHRLAFGGTNIIPQLNTEIQRKAAHLIQALRAFIHQFQIDVLVVQNALTIPMNVILGVALYEVILETQIPTIAHHHDFYWERERFLVNRIPSILRLAFPPDLPSIHHVVISTVMQRELQIRRAINAVYIPNVFDFENPPPLPDAHSNSFRAELGLGPDDVVLLQPTRLIARKSIERAIELVQMLGNNRKYHFVITGEGSDEPGPYQEWLVNMAVRSGIDFHFIGDRIDAHRTIEQVDGKRMYALWDVYPQCDLVTYLSAYEGFGNALIETLYFKRPLVTNAYPAYRSDIKPAGVRAIEINGVVTPETVEDVRSLIHDPARVNAMVEHNYQVGLDHFSYQVLERKLNKLLARVCKRVPIC